MALVQHKQVVIGAGASSVSATFTSATALNNRCIAGVALTPHTTTISSVTDNGSTPNSYRDDNTNLLDATVDETLNTRSANIASNPGSGNLQVTANFSTGANGGNLEIQEVSGLSTAANAVSSTGTTTHTANDTTSGSATTSGGVAANEYCFGTVGWEASITGPAGASGSTLDDSDTTWGSGFLHKLAAGGGTETINFTWTNSSGYLAQITVYKLAAAGTVAATTPKRAHALSFPTRGKSHLVVAAPKTPTFQSSAPVKAHAISPITRARSKLVLPATAAPASPLPITSRAHPVSPVTRARSKLILAAPLTPTFIAMAALKAHPISPVTRARTRLIVATLPAAVYPTLANRIRLSPSSKSKTRLIVAALPAAIYPTGVNRIRLSVASRARSRLILPASVTPAAIALAIVARSVPKVYISRSKSKLIVSALQTPTFAPTNLRSRPKIYISRSATRLLVPAFFTVLTTTQATKPMKAPIQPRPFRARPQLFVLASPPAPGVPAQLFPAKRRENPTRARSRIVPGIPPGTPGQLPTVNREQIS